MVEKSISRFKKAPVRLDHHKEAKPISPVLQNNPMASLVESLEVTRYFEMHASSYLSKLSEFIDQDSRWDGTCRQISVCIPSCKEEDHIFRTLSCLTGQNRDLLPKTEVLILDNYKDGEAPDNTYAEVERFTQEHPEVRVAYFCAEVGENVPFGSIRKALFDLALRRVQLSRKSDSKTNVLVSCDADVYGLSNDYLTSIVRSFNSNPDLDLLVGSFVYPEAALKKYPLLAAAFYFHRIYRTINEVESRNIPWSSGRTTAFSAKIYSAVGGLDGSIMRAYDIEFGRRVAETRQDTAFRFIRRGHFKIETDPRRVLSKMAQEDRCYSDEFEDTNWTRKVEVTGKSWTDYDLPELEVASQKGLEKEFSGILVKKAYRQGYVSSLRDFTSEDIYGMEEWIDANSRNISRVFRFMRIKGYSFDPSREESINEHRIPRIVVLK